MKPLQGGILVNQYVTLYSFYTSLSNLRDERHCIPLHFHSKIKPLCPSYQSKIITISLRWLSQSESHSQSSHSKSIGSLSNRRFWATLFNQKWAFFFLICLGTTKFLLLSVFPFKETIYPKFVQNHGWGVQKVHFRLTPVAQKRRRFQFCWK